MEGGTAAGVKVGAPPVGRTNARLIQDGAPDEGWESASYAAADLSDEWSVPAVLRPGLMGLLLASISMALLQLSG